MNFGDLYTLPRAGRYTNPLNSNDRLPLIYGDLTDGASGNWVLPCIDTANFVYCFAASAVLSVANGNSVTIYADGVEVDSADYTFDESNNYESEGTIATITFDADQANTIITARGKGKASGSSLIENIIDILDDFLTVENDFSSADYDSAAKATADALFTAQAYKAAGVIDQDINYWELLQRMMASFLGSIYFNAQKKLVIEIDDGVPSRVESAIIPKADIEIHNITQRIISLINQCPASYAYNYATSEFRSRDNGSTSSDTASRTIYGTREPETPYQFYWCRDQTSIRTMQAIVTGAYAKPVYEIAFDDLTMKRAHIDVGDVVAATFDMLYDKEAVQYINALIRILSAQPDLDRNRMTFRGMDTGYHRTVAYQAGGEHTDSIDNGLVAHWRMNEGTGTLMRDSSTNQNDGTLAGNITWIDGVESNGLNFTVNVADQINVPCSGLPDTAITVCCWVHVNVMTDWNDLIEHEWTAQDPVGWLLYTGPSDVLFGIWHTSGIKQASKTQDISDGWHFLVGTYDAATVRVYIDNVEGTPNNCGAYTLDSIGDVILVDNPENTKLDEVRIYNRVITESERDILYNHPDYNKAYVADGSIKAGGNRDMTIY